MMSEAVRRALATILGCTALACVLGIAVDMVTAHVAVDYFLIHHPRIIPWEQPWVLAIAWGIGASWWFGAIGGCVLAGVNYHRSPPRSPRQIMRWVAWSCAAIWAAMMLVLVAIMAVSTWIPVASRRETYEYDRRMVAVAMAHQIEYILGAIAIAVVGYYVWRGDREN